MVYFRLVATTLFPVLIAIIFYIAEKKIKWNSLPYDFKQIVTGIAFGTVACLATAFGIATDDVVLNVQNAAPLTAGLFLDGLP